jgi:hypothetical protein
MISQPLLGGPMQYFERRPVRIFGPGWRREVSPQRREGCVFAPSIRPMPRTGLGPERLSRLPKDAMSHERVKLEGFAAATGGQAVKPR